MQLTASEDIGLGIHEAFATATDAELLESMFRDRGVAIVRAGGHPAEGPGIAWEVPVEWNGRTHRIAVELTSWRPPEEVRFHGRTQGIGCDLVADFTAIAPASTRMRVALELRGSGLRDRMLLNTLALARGQIARRFDQRLGDFARKAEARAAALRTS